MVAETIALVAALVVAGAETLHIRRCRRLGRLAFGPSGRPAAWSHAAPLLRTLAVAAVVWGLVTLAQLTPKVHRAEGLKVDEFRHVVLVLDVSPSMRLQDAGPTRETSRMVRAREVMESFFRRVPIEQYRISVVATYTGAKPVVVDTTDVDVVRNILNDLPMHYAFEAGKTDLFAGLEEAAELARPWPPRSTTLILVSDGDTVPATGMPRMPASVEHVLVVGVGDPVAGSFIDGRQSRQETSMLRQIAVRLDGRYHNGNEKHLSSTLLNELNQATEESAFEQLTRREYALIAVAGGSSLLALLPLALFLAGSRWRPGVPVSGERDRAPRPDSRKPREKAAAS